MTSLAFDCPHCGKEGIGFTGLGQWDKGNTWRTAWSCNSCQEFLIVIFTKINANEAPFQTFDRLGLAAIEKMMYIVVTQYPSKTITPRVRNLPPEIADCHEKALRDFDNKERDEQACFLFRKTLDRATRQLLGGEAQGNSLNNRIDMLASRDRLTAELAEWAHAVRALGNDFIHDGTPTREDAEDMELLTRMLLIYCYELPALLAARKAARNA